MRKLRVGDTVKVRRGLQVGDTVKVRRGLLEGMQGPVLETSCWPFARTRAKVAFVEYKFWHEVWFRQENLELVETVEDQVERLR